MSGNTKMMLSDSNKPVNQMCCGLPMLGTQKTTKSSTLHSRKALLMWPGFTILESSNPAKKG